MTNTTNITGNGRLAVADKDSAQWRLTQAIVVAPVNFCFNCYSADTHHRAELSSNHQRLGSIGAAINRSASGGDVINLPLLFTSYRDEKSKSTNKCGPVFNI
jgi:hypothetical protein